MKAILLAALVATTTPEAPIDEKGELLYAESITICQEMVVDATLNTFETDGWDSMMGVIQMFSAMGMCAQYQGPLVIFPNKDARAHKTRVVAANKALLPDDSEWVVFRVMKAF